MTAVALAVCVAVGGAGCSVIPLSSAPIAPDAADAGAALGGSFQRLVPTKPRPEWRPDQVVMGMQAAMAAYADEGQDKTLWRYLTPQARKDWNPHVPVSVLDQLEVKLSGPPDAEARVQISGNIIAEIRADGRYVPMTAPSPFSRWVTLDKTRDQGYVVSGLSFDGLLLTAADVERSYEDAKLYYLDNNDNPVLDLVKIRRKPTENLAEGIVARLAQGPSEALRDAVHSALPPGTRVLSVQKRGEAVVVDLGGAFDPDRIGNPEGLKVQLGASLRNQVNGRVIEVLHDGEPFYGTSPLTISPSDYQPSQPQPLLANAYVLRDGAVLREQEPRKEFSDWVPRGMQPRPDFKDPAVSADGARIAVSGSDGIWVHQDSQWRLWIRGTGLVSPAWRPDGTLWTYDPARQTFLRFDPQGGGQQPTQIPAPTLTGETVERIKFARDGVRLAIIARDAGQGQSVQVGTILPGQVGNFRKLLEAKASKDREEIVDVAWENVEQLLVLTDQAITRVHLVTGPMQNVGGTIKDANSIASFGGRTLVGTDTRVLELDSTQKLEPLGNIKEGLPAYPAFLSERP
ncbi:LpqB family beta-propeller domain-containing protein [Thermoactinospora rubra]|uniref:LpqB family beta-propeller domain-containing protein n=1 Tax=Thermoactinospora rubra TaxID=1088767 RepID=UPI0011803150|nr:LpqB family beta-propeller domain-containing protein [Thermoactinospora rubra]